MGEGSLYFGDQGDQFDLIFDFGDQFGGGTCQFRGGGVTSGTNGAGEMGMKM